MINELAFNPNQPHIPVMLNEVLSFLKPQANEIYFDGTFGAGGYSSAILQSCNCQVYAVDQDHTVDKFVKKLQENFPKNFHFAYAKFSQVKEVLRSFAVEQVDGVVLDIGVSSMQFDEKIRGFSFDSHDKLDMRMNQNQELSAFEVVNNFSEEQLSEIIYKFGDEPKAKKIARKITTQRCKQTITSCCELADIVRSLYVGYYKTDPATRTFQALRIYVNNELEELSQALKNSLEILKSGGRMVVVTFHSLEDKIVKDFFREKSGYFKGQSRYLPDLNPVLNIELKLLNKSAIEPSDLEVKRNPRSRCAKLRSVVKL
ncbi:ribosomal RNA small subunit methyltransferase H [Alphaproteobacteria bacterium]|nr:ribosomal RNA small subunit methyltransferase H [Alphaproteobacteria bacterium]